MILIPHRRSAVVVVCLALVASTHAAADERTFTIASGGFKLVAPEGWQRVEPKSNMIETEFSIPPVGEGKPAGRMTVMGAGGSLQANIDRWYGQFSQPDGSSTKEKATTKTMKVSGCNVTIVDIPGTYKDMPMGPFAQGKAVDRPAYRMLAAIVETPSAGNYFLKFYGPAECLSKHADGFRGMIEGLAANK